MHALGVKSQWVTATWSLNMSKLFYISKTNLDVCKVDTVKVREHLVDLGRVLEDGTGCLGKVVQTCVATQSLGKCICWCYLKENGIKEWWEMQHKSLDSPLIITAYNSYSSWKYRRNSMKKSFTISFKIRTLSWWCWLENAAFVLRILFYLQQLSTGGLYLDADHFFRDVHHGIGQPALQALGKVADGLS